MLCFLKLLDLGLQLLDLRLLLVELFEVALVRGGTGRHLAQIRPQPGLVVGDVLELLLKLLQIPLCGGQLPLQLECALQGVLHPHTADVARLE